PGISLEIGQRVVRVCEAVVKFNRLLCVLLCFGQILFWVENTAANKAPVNVRQLSVSKRIIRITGNRLLEILTRFLSILGASFGTIEVSFEQEVISLRSAGLSRGEVLPLA